MLQPGLIGQAMFNPSYRDISYLAAMLEPTYVPQLGIGAYLHVVFSVCAPTAVVESFMRPERRTTPWLGWLGWPGTVGGGTCPQPPNWATTWPSPWAC
ncbi:hypothetical protein [Nonomuraea endophytica]|uniref:hypothetical protein n=1 Tax=Nonomuraea endophytica TaxID=714136 RepID=UPI0037CA9005